MEKKKATKLAQIAASPIQRREHKGKCTRFHLLPDLCPLCCSCCHEKSLTSIGSLLPTLSLTDWSCVESGLPTDVSDFSWQHEWHKGHKSGNKWKRVHFPRVPSLSWWCSDLGQFCGFFPHRVCELADFVKTTWRRTGIYNASLAS